MSKNKKPPTIKIGDSSHVSIRNNTGFFIDLEDSEKVDVTHNTVNSGSQLLRGRNLKDVNIHSNIQSEPNVLNEFITETAQHFHELTPDQITGFNEAIEAIKSKDEKNSQSAINWLYDLAVSLPSSGIAAVILKFFGL